MIDCLLGAHWRECCHTPLDVGIGHLVWIEFWSVAGWIKRPERAGLRGQPPLGGLGGMRKQIAQDREYLLRGFLDQPAQEAD